MLFEVRRKQNSVDVSRGWQLKGIVKKKTVKGRRLLYLGDDDVAIVTGGRLWRSWLRHCATSR